MIIFVLSLIQGLTEFLPISSSGHLILLPTLLGWQEHSIEIDGILHAGTLLAVMVYFWKDLRDLISGFFLYIFSEKGRGDATTRHHALMAVSILIATIPVVIAGFALKRMGVDLVRAPLLIAGSGIFWGSMLWLVDAKSSAQRDMSTITLKDSLIIGLAQVFSLIPGSSRSGMCMLAGRFLGFDRGASARYAFLMAIPAIGGAFLLIAFDAFCDGVQTPLADLGMYFILSFIFGLAAIHMMLRFVVNHSFMIFGLYRIILGIFTIYVLR